MEEFEPRKKIKIFTKEFYAKYSYVFIIAIVLFIGTSFGLTFFTQNMKIASGSLTTASLNVTLSNNAVSATGLTVPTTNQEGLSEFVKTLTITNNVTTDSKVKLTLGRTSGLNLTDMSYALIVNGAIQVIDDVPSDGVILDTAIMGNEVINVELRLWPKTSYSGNVTTFVGEIDAEIKYYGEKASNHSNLTNSYVSFNCNGSTCETWRIVGVQSERLILTREADLEGATSRVDSGKYNSNLTFNDNSMITSVSTDNKNVYLAKTVKISGGDGTSANPYTLSNPIVREPDKKIIAIITYKNGNTTVGTQYVYYNETNYISQILNDSGFSGWTDGTNDYVLGDTIAFTSDTNLTAKITQTLKSEIMTLCNDSNVDYVQKYDSQTNGQAIDTPNGSGNEDVCYYTTTSMYRNSDAEQNGNVIFGDYCWQIIRTTADGGVKLIYNGPKTTNDTCTSDADTNNYSNDPRPASIGVAGTATKNASLTGNKKYGTGFEIFTDTNDNNTNKFRLTNVTQLSWSDSTYKNIIGKYVCGNSSSPTGADETCTVMYYVGQYRTNNYASVVKYTISTNSHYSQIGRSPYNVYHESPALVGYMFNDVEDIKYASQSLGSLYILNRQSMSGTTAYYYGDSISWDGTNYHLLSNGVTPTTTSTWNDIRSSVGGMYTCKSNNSTTGTSCATVYYVVDNSSNDYMYSVELANNETKDKTTTWHYGTSITKSGNTYMLMDGNNESTLTKTFKVSDWYTTYNTDPGFANIYVCEDLTSTTCSRVYYLFETDKHLVSYSIVSKVYYFASDVNYDSSTNTYSYDPNGTIVEFYDWKNQYANIEYTHYYCENYNVTTNKCAANEPMTYVSQITNSSMYFFDLNGGNKISNIFANMLTKDTTENNQIVTVNKYNSAIKGVVDNWYKENIDDKGLTNYLDNNAVFCNDRNVASYGGFASTGSIVSNTQLNFKYFNDVAKQNVKLECSNVTDRFSVNNTKANLTYPVGMLTYPERALMDYGYSRTGQKWWIGSPNRIDIPYTTNRYISSTGNAMGQYVTEVAGIRPVIVLAPGIEISGGSGTYSTPYVVDTTSN